MVSENIHSVEGAEMGIKSVFDGLLDATGEAEVVVTSDSSNQSPAHWSCSTGVGTIPPSSKEEVSKSLVLALPEVGAILPVPLLRGF